MKPRSQKFLGFLPFKVLFKTGYWLLVSFSFLNFSATQAAALVTNTVTTLNDSGPGSLRAAIDDLNQKGGGKILFQNLTGTIFLNSRLPIVRANVQIEGPGASLLAISGRGTNSILDFAGGTSNLVRGLTIKEAGSSFQFASAISNTGILSIVDCELVDNVGFNVKGAAVSSYGGGLRLLRVLVRCNQSIGRKTQFGGEQIYGGAVYVENGAASITSCKFQGNRGIGGEGSNSPYLGGTASGGAINGTGSFLVVSNSLFESNQVQHGYQGKHSSGGAIMVRQRSSLKVSKTIFNSNLASSDGGAISAEDSIVEVEECSFFRNVLIGANATVYRGYEAHGGEAKGGAIYFNNTPSSISLSLFAFNSAVGGDGICGLIPPMNFYSGSGGDALGGAIAIENGNLFLSNSTISSNRVRAGRGATGCGSDDRGTQKPFGAGVYVRAGTVNVSHCTIVSNAAISNLQSSLYQSSGGGIATGSYPLPHGTAVVYNTILALNSATSGRDGFGEIRSSGYNLFGTAQTQQQLSDIISNPRLGPLAANGGPNLSHALLHGSPAIDAGIGSSYFTDGRGEPRTIDNPEISNASGGDGTDIGAFEQDPNLRFIQPRVNGEDLIIGFTSQSHKMYLLQERTNYLSTWLDVATLPGSGGILQFTNKMGSRGFYRSLER